MRNKVVLTTIPLWEVVVVGCEVLVVVLPVFAATADVGKPCDELELIRRELDVLCEEVVVLCEVVEAVVVEVVILVEIVVAVVAMVMAVVVVVIVTLWQILRPCGF